jgi:hypothetical protein
MGVWRPGSSQLSTLEMGRLPAAGESGFCGLLCAGRSVPMHGPPILISCRNLSDAVSVEVVTLGQDREPGVPVMSNIPLDLQRSCELRWAARFARPVPPSAPHEHKNEKPDQQLAALGKAKKKTRREGRRAGITRKRGTQNKP